MNWLVLLRRPAPRARRVRWTALLFTFGATAGVTVAGPARPTAAASCLGYAFSDRAGDASPDVVAYGLDYGCDQHRWTAWARTTTALAPAAIGRFELDLDTDRNAGTGCAGADWRFFATPSPYGGLQATVRHYPTSSCAAFTDQTVAMQAGADQARGPATVEVSASDGPLDYDRATGFRWWEAMSNASGTSVDQLPDGSVRRAYNPTATSAFVDRAPPTINGTYRLVTGDFNGDHRTDILFDTMGHGSDPMWFADPAHAGFAAKPSGVSGAWDRIVSGDFNGDGRSDLLLHRASGPDHILYAKPGGNGFTPTLFSTHGAYDAIVTGDFDGNHRADILFYRATGSSLLMRSMPNGTFSSTSLVLPRATIVVSGDFDGDGRADVLLYGAGTAPDSLWRGQIDGTLKPVTLHINGAYSQLVVGDFDADGRADLLCYGRGTAPDVLALGRPASPWLGAGPSVNLNEYYTQIVAGAFDGNATDDLLAYAAGPAAERWWVSTL